MASRKNSARNSPIPAIQTAITVLIVLVGLSALCGCASQKAGDGPKKGDTDKPAKAEKEKPEPEGAELGDKRTEYDLPPHKFITKGMDVSRVKSLVGEPDRKERNESRPDVWYYPFGLVMVEEGTVQYKYPPSPSQKEREKQAQRLETGP